MPEHKKTIALEQVILSAIGAHGPKTPEQVAELCSLPATYAGEVCLRLLRKRKLQRAKLRPCRQGSHTYSPSELAGPIIGKSIYFFPEQEIALGREISKYLPEEIARNMQKSITHLLAIPHKSLAAVRLYSNTDVSARVGKYFENAPDIFAMRPTYFQRFVGNSPVPRLDFELLQDAEFIAQGRAYSGYSITASGLEFARERYGLVQFLWFPFFMYHPSK